MSPTGHLIRTPSLAVAFAGFSAAVWLAGCGGSSSPTAPNADTPASGQLTIMMVDAPTDEICELWVYIEDLRVKPDGQPSMVLDNQDIGLVELLALRDGPPVTLGEFGVEAGRYQFIEMLLDQDRSFVVESSSEDAGNLVCPGEQVPLQIPSEKFKINGGPFDVGPNTTVTIDFDAEKSLKRRGSPTNPRGWQLKPEVSIIDVDQ